MIYSLCVFTVLQYAEERAGWRHRDISLGNIMIYKERGFLIDWELAQRPHLMNTGKPRLPDQTGTWKFISAARQLDPLSAPHLAMDDMESVFWAFLYLALRYGNHDLSGERIKERL